MPIYSRIQTTYQHIGEDSAWQNFPGLSLRIAPIPINPPTGARKTYDVLVTLNVPNAGVRAPGIGVLYFGLRIDGVVRWTGVLMNASPNWSLTLPAHVWWPSNNDLNIEVVWSLPIGAIGYIDTRYSHVSLTSVVVESTGDPATRPELPAEFVMPDYSVLEKHGGIVGGYGGEQLK